MIRVGRPARSMADVGQVGLPRPGRQDDRAPAAGLPPRLQALDLVRERLLGDLEPPRGRLVGPRGILVRPFVMPQLLDDRPVPDRLGAELPDAEVVLHARQAVGLVLAQAIHHERALVEDQPDRFDGVAIGRLAECGHQLGSPSIGGSGRGGDGFRFRSGRFNQPKSRLMGRRKPGRIGSPSRIPSSGNSSGDRPTR